MPILEIPSSQDSGARGHANRRDTNVYLLLADLKECSSKRNLQRGKQVHGQAIQSGHDSNIYVATTLIHMYAKCGSMVNARQVFDSIPHKDVVLWNALILGYAENREGTSALDMFTRMRFEGCVLDSRTFVAALKACSSLTMTLNGKAGCKARGKIIHDLASENCCDSDMYVQNTLIDMYAKCGEMADARQVLDSMAVRDVVSWNTLILGYADNGESVAALNMFTRMKCEGCSPDSWTFVAALKACTLAVKEDGSGKAECRDRGKQIHDLAFEYGCHSEMYVESILIDMYARSGSMGEARQLFDCMKHRDAVSWNALMLGYEDNGEAVTSLDMFTRMRSEGYLFDPLTFVAALKACTSLALKQEKSIKTEYRDRGKALHDLASEHGCASETCVKNTLISMYANCGDIVDARQVFDCVTHQDVVSWTAIILGYVENGEGLIALDMFTKMKSQSCPPNSRTFVAAVKACTCLATQENGNGKDRGRQIHNLASQNGCDSDIYVQSSFVDMYSRFGIMVDARQVFDSMKHRNVVSWNALILGYADNGDAITALDMFTSMRSQGFPSDSWTLVAAIKACGLLGALEFGREIHVEIDCRIETDVILVNSLIDFYAKCGSLVESQRVFELHPRSRDLITWNALLAGHSHLGDSKSVFRLFEEMQDAGFQPDGVTFMCILTCCSHAGLVGKGKKCFDSMSTKYGIAPTVEHYNCMVDILGRSNMLNEAIPILQDMAGKYTKRQSAVAWMSLLGACRKWKNVVVGRLAFEYFENKSSAAYALMAQIYGSRGMWQEQETVESSSKIKS